MKWNKFRLTTTTQAVDFVSGLLCELGIDGIEIEDKVQLSEEDKKKMFIDILPELPGLIYICKAGNRTCSAAHQTDALPPVPRNAGPAPDM